VLVKKATARAERRRVSKTFNQECDILVGFLPLILGPRREPKLSSYNPPRPPPFKKPLESIHPPKRCRKICKSLLTNPGKCAEFSANGGWND
jgi:hypothetical protein